MDQKQYKTAFKQELDAMLDLTSRKNADYAGLEDAFRNFRIVDHIGLCSVEQGIVVRMTDKLGRISNLLKADAQVKDEAITDTLRDLAVYSLILKIYLQNKQRST